MEASSESDSLAFPGLKDPEYYDSHIKLLSKSTNDDRELKAKMNTFCSLVYMHHFVEAARHDDWQRRINYLCGHHLKMTMYPPDDNLFKGAQLEAFKLGKMEVAVELFKENKRIISNFYENPNSNKIRSRVPEYSEDIVKEAETLNAQIKANEEDYLGLVEEHLGFPKGLDQVIDFAAKQLIIREKHIIEVIKMTAAKKSNNVQKNYFLVLYAIAMSKKRFLAASSLRQLLKIKKMSDEGAKRGAIGSLASLLVRQRFTNKLPDELLALLEPWEELSPFWFYCHAQLDLILMDLSRVKGAADIHNLLRPEVFYEDIVFGSVVLALRSEASEPYKTHLPICIFDILSHPDCHANAAMRACLDAQVRPYLGFGAIGGLTHAITKHFFEIALPQTLKNCAAGAKTRVCAPLSFQELQQVEARPKKAKESWFARSKKSKKMGKVTEKKPRRRPRRLSLHLGGIIDGDLKEAEAVANQVEEGSTEETKDVDAESSASSRETDSAGAASEATGSSDNALEDEGLQRSLGEILKPVTIDVCYDEAEAERYMAEFHANLSRYQEQHLMAQYEYDALRDAKKCLSVSPAPQLYSKDQHTIEFFGKDDFLALHPEANEVYLLNMYNTLAILGQSDATIRLQWVFAPEIVIGQDTFRFLCQVFRLDRGKGLLTFANFLRAFEKLTGQEDVESASGYQANKPVFRFNHAFVIDGQVCLPPIEEIHREHASSRFNWKRIRAFLMHGGAHPYFFRVIQSRYALRTPGLEDSQSEKKSK